MATTETKTDWTPPYASWPTLKNTIERMGKDGGVPARIDRSYLSNLPGGAQGEIQTTMKALGMVDEVLHPTETLVALVELGEPARPGIVKEIVTEHYHGPLSLGPMATQSQLEDEFRKYGVQGSTLRKAIRFFMNAAKFAEIPLSPHFKSPSAETSTRKPRKPRTAESTGSPTPAPPKDPQRTATTTLHPFIQGLVGSLPVPGSHFPEAMQEAWFDTARGIFRLIYAPTPESANPGGSSVWLDLSGADTSEPGGDDDD